MKKEYFLQKPDRIKLTLYRQCKKNPSQSSMIKLNVKYKIFSEQSSKMEMWEKIAWTKNLFLNYFALILLKSKNRM